MACVREGLSPFASHDYPEYETPSKQNENGPMTYVELITDLPRPHRKIDNTGTFFCVVVLF